MQPKEMMELGKEYGFKQTTIYRARKELEGIVVNTAGKRVRGNSWCMWGKSRGCSWGHLHTITLSHYHTFFTHATPEAVGIQMLDSVIV